MKKISLDKVFLFNYIKLMIVIIVITILGLILTILLNVSDARDDFTAERLMQDDYTRIDVSDSKQKISYCIIDDRYNVIYHYGEDIFKKDKISEVELINYVYFNSEEGEVFSLCYNETKHFWLVVHKEVTLHIEMRMIYNFLEGSLDGMILLIGRILFYLILISLGFWFHSKMTSKEVKKSLKHLKKMSDKVRNGEYDFDTIENRISEFSEVEEAFGLMSQKVNEEITATKKSEEERKKLILDVSHDLKNPMMSINGYAQLMKEARNNENFKEYIDIIIENSNRANNLVVNLFELSKIESAEYKPEFSNIDLTECLRKVLIDRITELEVNNIELAADISEEKISISGNEKELVRAFSNIIDNVIKYHREDGLFRIILTKKEKEVVIQFINTSSVELDHVEDALDPFVRMKGSQELNAEGAGIGLSVVKKVIEMHNGIIKCVCNENNEFEISLQFFLEI